MYMAAWRYKIPLLVLKNISFIRCAHSKCFSTLEEKFCISAQPCNILYILYNLQVYPAALRAQKRRQQEIKKKAQLREEAAKKKETPGHFDAEIAFPKSWWLTEYQRNYCREEDVKRHFLR